MSFSSKRKPSAKHGPCITCGKPRSTYVYSTKFGGQFTCAEHAPELNATRPTAVSPKEKNR